MARASTWPLARTLSIPEDEIVAIDGFDDSQLAALVTFCDEPSDIRAVATICMVLPLGGWLVTMSVDTVAPGIAGNDGAVGFTVDWLLPHAASVVMARAAVTSRHTRFIYASPCINLTLGVGNGFPLSPAVRHRWAVLPHGSK